MSHMVIYRGADGKPGYHQTDDIHDAVNFVEQMRNNDGVEHARIFRLEEVVFQYRPYYHVELSESGMPVVAANGSVDSYAADPVGEIGEAVSDGVVADVSDGATTDASTSDPDLVADPSPAAPSILEDSVQADVSDGPIVEDTSIETSMADVTHEAATVADSNPFADVDTPHTDVDLVTADPSPAPPQPPSVIDYGTDYVVANQGQAPGDQGEETSLFGTPITGAIDGSTITMPEPLGDSIPSPSAESVGGVLGDAGANVTDHLSEPMSGAQSMADAVGDAFNAASSYDNPLDGALENGLDAEEGGFGRERKGLFGR